MIRCLHKPTDPEKLSEWMASFNMNICTDNIRKDFILLNKQALSDCRKKYEINVGDMWNDAMDRLIKSTKFYDYNNVPAAFIHEKLVRGDLNGQTTAAAICDAMKKKPFECKHLHNTMMRDNKDILKAAFKEDELTQHALILFYILTSWAAVYCLYQAVKKYFSRKVMEDLEDKAEAMVSSYHRMKDDSFEDSQRTSIEMS